MSRKGNIFEEWVDLNRIVAPWRCRFDAIRISLESLESQGRLTKAEFRKLLKREQYDKRYPLVPERLS